MTIKSKSFREDINGLRAWAVIAVIFYHFGIIGFSGGFVGVDIFFVISGFLMTGLVVSGLDKSITRGDPKSGFSLINFYLSRARRIIPALLMLCTIMMVVGWFFLSSLEYMMLSTHVVSALGFFSNIQFLHEAGYFDTASHDKLLLHTWSLSVEWQFYLILPLALLATWKIHPGRISLTLIVALGLVFSLLLSIVFSPFKPTAAFYLLPTRAWEMLAGGLVYLLANQLKLSSPEQRILEGSGFALIIASIALFDEHSNWPGWRALIPVIGTVHVLIAARRGSLWSGSHLAQWLGDCSYSLYLWHWPFVVALVYLQLQDHAGAIIIGLTLTLVCGWLSYRLVETPASTFLTRIPYLAGTGVLLMAIFAVTLPSIFVRLQQGIPSRMPSQINAVFNEAENKNPRLQECHVRGSTPVPECTYGGDQLGVIVIGDSHASSVVRSVEKSLPDRSLNVLDWTLSSCPTISGIKKVDDPSYRCGEFVKSTLNSKKLLGNSAPLIIVNRLSETLVGRNESDQIQTLLEPDRYISSPYKTRSEGFFQEMREGTIKTACEFAKTRVVYMVRPIPELKIDVPRTMGRALMRGEKIRVSISLAEYHQRNDFAWETQNIAAERCGVKILDPTPYLCNDGRCWGDIDGLPIYYDDNHLNERGGSLLIPMFRQVFKDEFDPEKQEMVEVKAEVTPASH